MTDRRWYIAAINRVVDHIDAHLPEPLDLETLAGVAALLPTCTVDRLSTGVFSCLLCMPVRPL